MLKRRAGLHREVSSIFDGVPIPKESGAEQPISAPPSEPTSDVTAKPAAPVLPTAQTPKPQQPEQAPPKADMPKRPKPDATIKTARQIPGQQAFEQIKNKLLAPKLGVSAGRQKTTMILIPVLFIVLIFVFIRVFSTPSRAKATPAELGPSSAASSSNNKAELGPSSATSSSNNKIDWQIPALYPETLRDPTQFGSVATTQAETGRLIVKGIVYSEDDPAALIGTRIVRQGDKVLGATVVKINIDSVEFEMNEKRWMQKVQR